jgi:predicted ATPase
VEPDAVRYVDRFFVITGGPGSGKSTLLEALRRAGCATAVEAGRGVIQDQMRIGGRGLPWCDPEFFAELMLSWDMRSYREASQREKTVFFDRGVVDVAAYLRLSGFTVPQHVLKAVECCRYNRRVFIAPPWKEIYGQDTERKQTFDEAVRTYQNVAAMYLESGYQLIEIPRGSVEERARFVIEAARTSPE